MSSKSLLLDTEHPRMSQPLENGSGSLPPSSTSFSSSSSPSASMPRMVAPSYGNNKSIDEAAQHTGSATDKHGHSSRHPLSHDPDQVYQHHFHTSSNHDNQHQRQHSSGSPPSRNQKASSGGDEPMALDSFVSEHLSSNSGGGGSEEGASTWARNSSNARLTSSSSDFDESQKCCRICFETKATSDPALGRLISPCLCKGSSKYIHLKCLEQWQRMSPRPASKFQCDTCHYQYLYSRPKIAAWLEKRWFAPLLTFVITVVVYYLLALLGHALDDTWGVWHWKPKGHRNTVLGIHWMDLIFAVVAALVLIFLTWLVVVAYGYIADSFRRMHRRTRRTRREQRSAAETTWAMDAAAQGQGGERQSGMTTAAATTAGAACSLICCCCCCCSSYVDEDIEAAASQGGGHDNGAHNRRTSNSCCLTGGYYGDTSCDCGSGGGECEGVIAFVVIMGVMIFVSSLYFAISFIIKKLLATMKTRILEVK